MNLDATAAESRGGRLQKITSDFTAGDSLSGLASPDSYVYCIEIRCTLGISQPYCVISSDQKQVGVKREL